MTHEAFVKKVTGALTASCGVPNMLPPEEVDRVIEDAAEWFYPNYGDAVESRYIIIRKEVFESEWFKQTRRVKLPACIQNVHDVKEIKPGGRIGALDRDITENRLIAAEIYLSPLGDDIVMRTAQYHFYDLMKAFSLEMIHAEYNSNTRTLVIKGRDPRVDVLIEAAERIPIHQLYEDILFRRYVVGLAKQSLGAMAGTFDWQLLGGVKFNADAIISRGEKEVEDVLKQIDDENTPSYFMFFHAFWPLIPFAGLLLSQWNNFFS